jgi:predicted nucleic acid-binding protein
MIYLDSGVIIRLIEGTDRVRDPIESRLRAVSSSDRLLVTSRLSRLECRCKPLREGRLDLLAMYDKFFALRTLLLKEIDAAVVEKATTIRADFGLKSADAIHAATGVLWGVSAFWTADASFSRCTGLPVELFAAV